jgi:hypothetical protein
MTCLSLLEGIKTGGFVAWRVAMTQVETLRNPWKGLKRWPAMEQRFRGRK